MSKAKTDKLGLRLPKELIWGCVCCSLRTNPGKESRAETGASEAAREISSLKVGKMLLQRKLIRGFFYQQKKRRKRDWQKKFTRQLFIFFIYLPFKNTGLKWVFLLLLQAHQKSKYILQFSLDFSKSVCREWKNKVTISISYSFHPHLIEIVLLLMSFIIIVRRGPVHLSAALVAAQLI